MQELTQQPVEQTPPPSPPALSPEEARRQRQALLIITGVLVVFIVITLAIVYYLLQPTTDTEKIRDVFIISDQQLLYTTLACDAGYGIRDAEYSHYLVARISDQTSNI